MSDINKAVLRGRAVINDGEDIVPWTAETMEQAILIQRQDRKLPKVNDPRLPSMPDDPAKRRTWCASQAAKFNRQLFGMRGLIGEWVPDRSEDQIPF